ncbi:MAG TPA: serine hydrolase domain-containing protein [Gemmatimonadaceae bacterium]|nr:serine hydrolase domain-containing protein [Gemmatimonadaceae bacterium]
MRRSSLTAIAGLLGVVLAGWPTTAHGQSLAARIRADARRSDFSGTILVERDGRTLFHEGFGLADRSFAIPARADTRYKIASITKAFTAALVLQLHEEGKVDLDASIRRYLPAYRGDGAERVTLRQLLNHTSGIENFDQVKTLEEAVTKGIPAYQLPHTTDQLLEEYSSGKVRGEPGKVFDYNNADYVILGKVIERVVGAAYDSVLAQRILRPLAMTNTGMLNWRDVVPRLAPTYMKVGNGVPLIHDLPVYPENWYAAGALYSTTSDLLKFAQALYGGRLLKPESLTLMLTPGLDEYGFGLWARSVDIDGRPHRVAQRPGGIMGANTLMLRYLDDGVTVIILGNTDAADVDALGFAIGRHVLAKGRAAPAAGPRGTR